MGQKKNVECGREERLNLNKYTWKDYSKPT